MATLKTLLPPAYQTLEDLNGAAIANGTVTFYETGTATLAVVYADANGLVISANPLVVDAAGRYTVWLTPGQVVDVEYRDALGALVKTVPGVMATPGASGNVDVTGTAWVPITAGQVVYQGDGVSNGGLGAWTTAQGLARATILGAAGIALTSAVAGAPVVVRTAGLVEGLSGLVVGARYYVGDGVGTLSLTPGKYGRLAGQAVTPTSLIVLANPPELAPPDTMDFTGTGTVAQLVPTARTVRIMSIGNVTIQGIKAGYHGQRLRIMNISAQSQVDLVSNSGAVAAVDRLFNVAGSAPTSMATGTGRGVVEYEYDGALGGWRMTAHEQGGWITPPFNAGDYSAAGAMTWTVAPANALRCAYYLRGQVLQVQLTITNTTVGGSVSGALFRLIPGGFLSSGQPQGGVRIFDAAGLAPGAMWIQLDGGGHLAFQKDIAGNAWALGTLHLLCEATLSVR